MSKIVSPDSIEMIVSKWKKNGEKIVLAGGCFDILHEGHLIFIKSAKKHGTKLIILLESDANVKKLKGEERPIHPQTERAKILSSVKDVDLIVMLSEMKKAEDYAKLINQIKPDVVAVTKDDPYGKNKTLQAENAGAKLVAVTKRVEGKSTTRLVDFIKRDL
jgi:FAD synthetase